MEYIPIHEYAKKMNTSKQNVYRWIRENKFLKTDFKKDIIQVERFRIKKDAIKQ